MNQRVKQDKTLWGNIFRIKRLKRTLLHTHSWICGERFIGPTYATNLKSSNKIHCKKGLCRFAFFQYTFLPVFFFSSFNAPYTKAILNGQLDRHNMLQETPTESQATCCVDPWGPDWTDHNVLQRSATLPTQDARSNYPPHVDNLDPRTPTAILLCWYQPGHSYQRFPLGFFAVGRICQTIEFLTWCQSNCLCGLRLKLFSGTNLPSQPWGTNDNVNCSGQGAAVDQVMDWVIVGGRELDEGWNGQTASIVKG